jgi:hypothetical protein
MTCATTQAIEPASKSAESCQRPKRWPWVEWLPNFALNVSFQFLPAGTGQSAFGQGWSKVLTPAFTLTCLRLGRRPKGPACTVRAPGELWPVGNDTRQPAGDFARRAPECNAARVATPLAPDRNVAARAPLSRAATLPEAILVIDARPDGLPQAPLYYATFPREPSPLGTLTFTPAKTTAMNANSSLFAALPELTKAGAAGAAVLVCHAYSGGLLLPVAPGGQHALADSGVMARIDQVIEAEAEHARILKLPRETDAQRKQFRDRWAALLNGLKGGSYDPHDTENDLETKYGGWVDSTATIMEFRSAVELRLLLQRVLTLRAVKLGRLELRACKVGGDPVTMDRIQKFFNCDKVTAPTVGTFYNRVPIAPLVIMSAPRGGNHGAAQRPGPLRHSDFLDSAWSSAHLIEEHTRGFLPFAGARVVKENAPLRSPVMHVSGRMEPYSGFRFVLRVVQKDKEEYKFAPVAWAAGSTRAAAPDPDIINQFCKLAFKSDTTFNGTDLPHAGLWTPSMPTQPFVPPLEKEYLPLIAQFPKAQPSNP